MPEVPLPSLTTPDVPRGSAANHVNLVALAVQGVTQDIWAAYEDGLCNLESCHLNCDRKSLLQFQRTLRDHETLGILQVIWKESPYLSDVELQAFGIRRIFCERPLTCWGLAREIAESARDLGKVHKRVVAIVRAGSAYGLIEAQKIRAKMVSLRGSARLHEFMIDFSIVSERIIRARMGENSGPGDEL